MMIRWRGGSSSSSLQSFFQQLLLPTGKWSCTKCPTVLKNHIRKYTLDTATALNGNETHSLFTSLRIFSRTYILTYTYKHTYKHTHILTLWLAVTNFSSSFYLLQSTDKRVLSTDLTLFFLSVSRKVYFSLIHSQQFPKKTEQRENRPLLYTRW